MTFIIDFFWKILVTSTSNMVNTNMQPRILLSANLVEFRVETENGLFQRPLDQQNLVDDFSTRLSLITREQNQLQSWILSQNISLVILHRLMLNLSDCDVKVKTAFQRPLGRQNLFDDFSTRFSTITRDWNMLENCKLSQKIPLVILHRLVYNLSRKVAYLKSEFVKIGRFWVISGLFLDFVRFGSYEWEAGLDNCARGDGRS